MRKGNGMKWKVMMELQWRRGSGIKNEGFHYTISSNVNANSTQVQKLMPRRDATYRS